MSDVWGISMTDDKGIKFWLMCDAHGFWSQWMRPAHASWWESEQEANEAKASAPDPVRFDGRVEKAPPGLFQAEDYTESCTSEPPSS